MPSKNKPVKYDLLIWGTIKKYKGIDKFLDYLYKHHLQNKYKIYITGSVSPPSYKNKLNRYLNENIKLYDEFLTFEQLAEIASESLIILFPYIERSVLSSGALMDSLVLGPHIIGPDTGAFKDLKNEGIIETYTHYDDLIKKIDLFVKTGTKNSVSVSEFIEENSWQNFSHKINNWLVNILP
ncbi:MAG: hypothetical protein HC906_04805 [Bacteroidales bacterium]|nr:hypothetical protein [Bacteroidales bacterium]